MNEENKKQIIVAAVLGVVLIGVLIYQFVLREPPGVATNNTGQSATKTQTTPRPAVKPAQEEATLPQEVDVNALIASVEVKPFDYGEVRIGRNPMAPLIGALRTKMPPEGAPTEVITKVAISTTAARKITGIIWDKINPVAIVDDVVVHIGYTFPDGVQVYQIEPSRVLFKVGETIVPVEMKEF